MSMLVELRALIAETERSLDTRINQLNSYKGKIDQGAQRVEAALSGSEQAYNVQMVQQLASTRSQIDTTIEQLQMAKRKLAHLKTI